MKLFKSSTDLFKIEDFKGLNYSKDYIDCCDVSLDEDWEQFLNDNLEFKEILIKIGDYCFGSDNYNIEDDMFCDFNVRGDLSKDLDRVYIQIDGQSSIHLVDNLNQFSEDYRTEEDWGVKNWSEIN
jgi:hypothetical protein